MPAFQKWHPSRDLERFRREVDELLERFGFEHNWVKEWQSMPLRPPVESFIDGGKFTVRIDLPGVNPADISARIAGGVLTVKGHREEKQESRSVQYLRRERRYGSFERIIQLPEGVEAEGLKATYRHGVLELTARLSKEATPREFTVQIERSKLRKPEGKKSAC